MDWFSALWIGMLLVLLIALQAVERKSRKRYTALMESKLENRENLISIYKEHNAKLDGAYERTHNAYTRLVKSYSVLQEEYNDVYTELQTYKRKGSVE